MTKKLVLGAAALMAVLIGIGIYLAYEPDIPRAVLEAKYATPPSKFLVLSDGTRVHYRDRGPHDAPIIIMLHGSDSSLFDWEPWSKNLSDTFRVVTFDFPGHGLTGATVTPDYSEQGMTKFVRDFADSLGLKQFALVGNSLGGGVAARFAELYPERVTRLVIVDGHTDGLVAPGKLPFVWRLGRTPVANKVLLKLTPRVAVEEGLNKAVAHKAMLTNDVIDRFWDFLRMEGTRPAALIRFNLAFDTYVRDHARSITTPTLILWGEDDDIVPVAAARAWAKAIPNSRLIIYPATGHIPMEEVPEKSATDVRAFLEAH